MISILCFDANILSRIVFLGTGSAVPAKRNVSSLGICLSSGTTLLVDCGEATQHQLMKSNLKMGKINHIFITHLHGDHCYGLFGLLSTIYMNCRTEPLNLYGPVGLKELLNVVFKLTTGPAGWTGYELRITELDGEREFLLEDNQLRVIACPLKHVVPAFGYVFQETTTLPKLNAEIAIKLGAVKEELRQLKEGHDVVKPDGRIIRSVDCLEQNLKMPKKIAIIQDTCDSTAAHRHLQNVDVLIHECTYDKTMREKAIEHGHSTSQMAGETAAVCGAKKLVLSHFSSRISDTQPLIDEAKTVFTTGEIIAAEDFTEISLI